MVTTKRKDPETREKTLAGPHGRRCIRSERARLWYHDSRGGWETVASPVGTGTRSVSLAVTCDHCGGTIFDARLAPAVAAEIKLLDQFNVYGLQCWQELREPRKVLVSRECEGFMAETPKGALSTLVITDGEAETEYSLEPPTEKELDKIEQVFREAQARRTPKDDPSRLPLLEEMKKLLDDAQVFTLEQQEAVLMALRALEFGVPVARALHAEMLADGFMLSPRERGRGKLTLRMLSSPKMLIAAIERHPYALHSWAVRESLICLLLTGPPADRRAALKALGNMKQWAANPEKVRLGIKLNERVAELRADGKSEDDGCAHAAQEFGTTKHMVRRLGTKAKQAAGEHSHPLGETKKRAAKARN